VAVSVVLCAGYTVIANINVYNKRKVWVKKFANVYYKDKKSIVKGVICSKDKKVTSLIKVKLRQS
jgi:hypothetical protein